MPIVDNPFPYVVRRWRGAEPAAFINEELAKEYQEQHAPSGCVVYKPLIDENGKLLEVGEL